MPALEHVVKAIQSKSQPSLQFDFLVSAVEEARAQLSKDLDVHLEKFREVVSQEARDNSRLEQVVTEALSGMMSSQDRALQAIESLVKSIKIEPQDLSPILTAIRNIRIPDFPTIPEFPEIPEPKREWTFEIERDSRGYLKRVHAK